MKLEINWGDELKRESSILYKGEVWDYFDEGLSRRVYVNSERTKVVKFLIEPMGVDYNEIENRIYQTAVSKGELAHTQLVDGVIEQEFLEPIKWSNKEMNLLQIQFSGKCRDEVGWDKNGVLKCFDLDEYKKW
jgi:hypothetical protein